MKKHLLILIILPNWQKKIEVYDSLKEEEKDLFDILGPMNIEARYPFDKEKMLEYLSEENCEELISKTEELITWINKKL